MANCINWHDYTPLLTVVFLLMIIPYPILHTYRLWSYRHHTVFSKRYVSISLQQCCLIFCLIAICVTIIINDTLVLCANDEHFAVYTFIQQLELFGMLLFQLMILWTGLLRFYLLYFDMSWLSTSLTHKWHQIIRPTNSLFNYNHRHKWSSSTPTTTATQHRVFQHFEWLIHHKSTYGSYKFMIKFPYIISLLCLLFIIIARISDVSFSLVIFFTTVFELIPALFIVYFFVQIKFKLQFKDNFFVGTELSYYVSLLSLNMVLFCFTNVLLVYYCAFDDNTSIKDVKLHLHHGTHLLFMIEVLVVMISMYLTWLLLTKWLFIKIEHLLQDPKLCINNTPSNQSTNKSSRTRFSIKLKSPHGLESAMMPLIELHDQINSDHDHVHDLDNTNIYENDIDDALPLSDVTLSEVLSDENGIDLLMQHLSREFSMECLLSLIEFIQFQIMIYNYISNQALKPKLFCVKTEIDLPLSIPISGIVLDIDFGHEKKDSHFDDDKNENIDETNNDQIQQQASLSTSTTEDGLSLSKIWILDAKMKSIELYRKYVAVGSEYQINLSTRTRERLTDRMDNSNQWIQNQTVSKMELFYLFDKCCQEMFYLLQGSFARFKEDPQFKKLLALQGLSTA